MKVCHLTSVHPRTDTRIFLKECRSLAKAGYEISLIVADGKGDELRDGVRIFDVRASIGRLDRIRNATKRVFKKAVEVDALIYHFHDPELMTVGLGLKRLGKRVIFDSHEDVPQQLLNKPYLNKPTLWLLSKAFALFESHVCRRLNGVIAATPAIRDKFQSINPITADINNFPLLGELLTNLSWDSKRAEVCYVGGIAQIRGAQEVCRAMGLLKSSAKLNLCGKFSNVQLEMAVKALPGWERVVPHGYVNREGVREILSRSMAGIVTFHPLPNHIDAQPNKMFEYMSAGIPVIASDFPLWREIIEGNQCGLLVDPLNPEAIAEAIDYLVTHPLEAQQMGANGRKAVEAKYNWDVEERKLWAFYERTLGVAGS